jgi:hypothetical protein
MGAIPDEEMIVRREQVDRVAAQEHTAGTEAIGPLAGA